MILITSTLVLFMVSVGNGNPLPEPNPDLVIQVRQVVHRLNCKKPHDAEGPFGHPTTEATGGDEELEKKKEELEAEITEAEKALNETNEAVQTLTNEVADQQAAADAVDDILDELDFDFDSFRRKRQASVYENVENILDGLGDLLGESHRNRRAASGSATYSITYCQEGTITNTGFNLWSKLLTDLAEALTKTPKDIAALICFKEDKKTLKALGIQFTAEEKQKLIAKKNDAKAKAETAKQEAETALAKKQADLEAKKAEQAVIVQNLKEKNDKKKEIEAQLAGITLAPETTDLPDTTIETTITTKEVTTAAVEIPPTTVPRN